MKVSFRHWGLIFGVLCVICSFLFFGRQQDVYQLILVIGIALSIISFTAVLFKEKGRAKLFWIGVVLGCIILQQLTQGWLISKSFQILISQHQFLFDKANEIMLSKSEDITYWSSGHKDSKNDFSEKEIALLERLKTEAGLTYVTKSSTRIFYETYGFLDVRVGISFFYKDSVDDRFTKIKGQWYY